MAATYTPLPTTDPPPSASPSNDTEKPVPTRFSRLQSFLRLFIPLLPWALQTRLRSSSPSRKPLRSTAYLDGLRGFAAFFVYLQHHHVGSHLFSPLEFAFGHHGDFRFGAFPVIRTFFNGGSFAVAIFYVISGYVLSARSLGYLHSGQPEKAGDGIASALVRRWARLYFPVFATTFGFLTFVHLFGVWQELFPAKESYAEELSNWYNQSKQFSYIFGPGFLMLLYNPHLWSIPLEFKGSIVVYTTLQAFSRWRTNFRFGAYMVLLWYFFFVVDGWFASHFIGGMILGDIDAMNEHEILPTWMARLSIKRFRQLAWTGILLFGWYLGNAPTNGKLSESPGYEWLHNLNPDVTSDNWFIMFFGSMIAVAASQRVKWFKFFLETKFIQYLGRISYALYMIHGPVLWTAGVRVFSMFGLLGDMKKGQLPGWSEKLRLPGWGLYGLEISFIGSEIILLPVTLWLAELVTTSVDEPVVKILQNIYRMGLPREE